MSVDNQDIWRLQAQYDVQGLTEALKSTDAVRRKRAAAALRAIGARESIPALRVAFEKEADEDARSSIASALVSLAEVPAHETAEADVQPSVEQTLATRLIRQLESADPAEVIDAAHQLGELGDRQAVEPLVMLFHDVSRSVELRLAVAEALLKLESAPVEVTLLATLRHNEWQTRRNGAAILGQLRAGWAVPPLVNAMRDPHPIVRRTARAALRRIGTPEARRALEEYAASQIRPTLRSETGLNAPGGGLLSKVSPDRQASSANTQPLDSARIEEIERLRAQAAQQGAPATEKIEAVGAVPPIHAPAAAPAEAAPAKDEATAEKSPAEKPEVLAETVEKAAVPAQAEAAPAEQTEAPAPATEEAKAPAAPALLPTSRANTQPLDPARVERIEAGLAPPPEQGVLKHITTETSVVQPAAQGLTQEDMERLRKLGQAIEESIHKDPK